MSGPVVMAPRAHGKTDRQVWATLECLRAGNTATMVVGSHARKAEMLSRLRLAGASSADLMKLIVIIERSTRLHLVR
jgi:hypothetical protein